MLPSSPALPVSVRTPSELQINPVTCSPPFFSTASVWRLSYPYIQASISTFAGNGAWAYVDNANPKSASFRNPQSLAIDPLGNVFIADSVNAVIRKVAASNGAVSTIAGNGKADYKGDGGYPSLLHLTRQPQSPLTRLATFI